MARIHIWKDKFFIAANKNIFEFKYSVNEAKQSPELKLLRTVPINFNGSVMKVKVQNTNALRKNNPKIIDNQILASALNNDGTVFAVATTSKECFLYNIADNWAEIRPAIQLPKAATAVIFECSNKYVILSDRAGNVRQYCMNGKIMDDAKVETCGSEDESREGELLLGHVSMVLDIDLSDDGRFLISADRDEKIRISRYPQCFVLHRFCLGHTSYVNSVHSKNGLLFSSGGDGTIRVWNIEDGKQVAECDCFEKKAIRCCRIFPNCSTEIIKFAVVFERCKTVQIITFNKKRIIFEKESMYCPDIIIDIAIEENGVYVFGITCSSVVYGIVGESYLKVISNVDSNMLGSLLSVKDMSLPLEKKIGYNNIEEYKQRKNERINAKRRKLTLGNT